VATRPGGCGSATVFLAGAMADLNFHRWNNALAACMAGTQKKDDKLRWRDPIALNQEAHELPKEKQRQALDFLAEASPALKAKLAPMWKFCFAQWHIYDAGIEAIAKGTSVPEALMDKNLLEDIDALEAICKDGGLDDGMNTEKWSWKILQPFPPAGTLVPWNEESAAPLLKAGKEERKQGIQAFEIERYDKAFWHFWQGLKMIARAPATTSGPHAKLRSALLKNKAAAAMKLNMNRTALGDANEALRIDSMDDKAWYRQSCALEALGRLEEAKAARVKAGLVADGDEISPSLALKTDGSDAKQEQAELDPDLCEVLESFMFIELGVDSIIATDMVMYLKAEFPRIPLPCTLVFEYPTAGDVVAMLLSNISGGNDPFLRRKVTNCVWQAMCASMGRDPLQDIVDSNPRTLSEGVTADILADLLRAYHRRSGSRLQPCWPKELALSCAPLFSTFDHMHAKCRSQSWRPMALRRMIQVCSNWKLLLSKRRKAHRTSRICFVKSALLCMVGQMECGPFKWRQMTKRNSLMVAAWRPGHTSFRRTHLAVVTSTQPQLIEGFGFQARPEGAYGCQVLRTQNTFLCCMLYVFSLRHLALHSLDSSTTSA